MLLKWCSTSYPAHSTAQCILAADLSLYVKNLWRAGCEYSCLCPSPGALHQFECEEECLSEHTESGRPAQRVLHHILRHTPPASCSLQTDMRSTLSYLWTCTHTVVSHVVYHTYIHQNSTTHSRCRHDLSWCLIHFPFCELNDKIILPDSLAGWMHLKERPENPGKKTTVLLCDSPNVW